MNRASAFARPAPVPEVGAGAPLTRRQLRELAQAQQAAEQEAQQSSQRDKAEPRTETASAPEATRSAQPVAPTKPAKPARPLSRRELRERAAAEAAERAVAEQVTESVAPSKSSGVRPVPAVQPPAATGAIRALDETGQLTPVRRVTVATGKSATPAHQVPGLEPAQKLQQARQRQPAAPNRVGVRESLAQVEAAESPRVYPQSGATPTPAMPTGQHTPLASGPAAIGAWAPVSNSPDEQVAAQNSPAARGEAGSASSGRGLPAPVAVTAVPTDSWSAGSWQPVTAAQQQEQTTGPSPQSAASSSATSAAETEHDPPAIPQWGSVLSGSAERNSTLNAAQNFGPAPVVPPREEPADNEEEEPGGWLRYTPLQFLVLIVLGLVLGGLVWQLLNVTSGPEAEQAQSAPSQVQVIEFEQSYV